MILRRLPGPTKAPLLWGSGVLSVSLLAWMNLSFASPFFVLAGKRTIPDLDLNGTVQSLLDLKGVLEGRPEAADLLRSMHLGPDLLLPAVLAFFLFLLMRRVAPGANLYGRPVERLLPILLALPVAYGVIDYVENITSLLLFPPSRPASGTDALLAEALVWFTRLKFLFLVVSGILILRLSLGPRDVPQTD